MQAMTALAAVQGLRRLMESAEIQHLFQQGMSGQVAGAQAGRLNNLPVLGAANAFAQAPVRQVIPYHMCCTCARRKMPHVNEPGRPQMRH